jgi:Cd2+/Zn2+-exporting ATPase
MTTQEIKIEGPAELPRRYKVAGMDCASCVMKIETALSHLPGVSDVQATATTETLRVRFANNDARLRAERQIAALGYGLRHLDGNSPSPVNADVPTPWWRASRVALTASFGVALAAAYALGRPYPVAEPWAFGLALAIGLIPIGRRALSAAWAGTPFSIEMLMSVAAIGAIAIGAIEEAATVVFLFLVGELLEGVAASGARQSIRGLTALIPKAARRIDGGAVIEVNADSLVVGDTIFVRPGDRIPADGVVVEGDSTVNEAPVTGESVPVRKTVGQDVFAGTVNGESALRIRVSAAAADNTIARVIRLVEEAQESKAPTERFIDRFSRYYTPGVVVFAALVALVPPLFVGALWNEWIYKGLAMLLIGCPCALVISTPAAIAAALSAGARRGLLMKGGAVLEELGELTTIAFDKTATLTEGTPKVTDVVPVGRSSRQVLSFAAALETGSSHPLALAIVDHAKAQRAPVPPATETAAVPGKGVSGRVGPDKVFLGSPIAAAERVNFDERVRSQLAAFHSEGKTVSALLVGDSVAGLIALRDEPRPDAKTGLAMLSERGIKTVMLTGDNEQTAQAVGRLLGIQARGELLPEDKLRLVEELKQAGERVGKVGDGINDAPALAAADIGIAMGSGTDVALETADAAILHGRVSDVAEMVTLSRRTMRNIHQNIAIALGLKAVFLVTTLLGITGLWPAILADTGATVLVTANALRLLAPAMASRETA